MKLLLLWCCLFFAIPVSAETIRCDGCGEPAYQSAAAAAGNGIHYVYDLPGANTRKFEVWRECGENLYDGRTYCEKRVSPLAVEPEVAAFVLELAAYHRVTNGTMKSVFVFDATGAVEHLSAFDVAGPGGPREALIDWFNSTQLWSVQNALPMIGASAHNITVTIASLWNDSMGQTHAVIRFRDGSQFTLSYEMVNNSVVAVEGSARDKYSNIVPGTPDEANGLRFDYSAEGENGPAQQRMRDYLDSLGIEVPVTGKKWVCVQVGESQWHCGYF